LKDSELIENKFKVLVSKVKDKIANEIEESYPDRGFSISYYKGEIITNAEVKYRI
jgi:hypothetical protein